MDKGKILELCMDVRYNKSSVENQTPEQRKAELCELFRGLMKDYRRNKITINEIIEENINEVLKQRVNGALDIIADIVYLQHGQSKKWHVKNGKITARWTALGSESYRQKIYKKSFVSTPKAADFEIYEELDDILAGRAEAFTDMMNAGADALTEKVMLEIETAIVAAMASAPSANLYSGVFSLAQVRNVCQTVSAYGVPVIVGTAVALANITSDDGFKAALSDNEKEMFNRNGYIGYWEGKAIIQLPNTFTDENNTAWVLSNAYLYIIPVNADKPVKLVFEGGALIQEDSSYSTGQVAKKTTQKFGTDVLQYHNLGLITIS